MKIPANMPRLKGLRFSREVVAYAVWIYHRFALSTADVEDLLAERGVTMSGVVGIAKLLFSINGQKYWLWRAIDANGNVLEILIQSRKNGKAARRFFQKLISLFGEFRVVIIFSRAIAAQCTVGQRTCCEAILSLLT